MRPGWNIPFNAVLVSLAITILLSLINIGATEAFNAIVSLGVASLLSSYIISFVCLVIKRIRKEPFPPARWSLGKHGMWINMVSIVFLSVIWVFSFFPLGNHPTAKQMNWNVVIYFSAIIFAVVYYHVKGKRVYVGPVTLVKSL